VIVAADEAGVYLQASVLRVWAPTGQTPVVKRDPGRQNTHVYGALNLATGEQVSMRADLMVAQVSALFLSRLLLRYPDTPILLLWDRAPWHKGEAIRAVPAANPRLEILWFPPGCPELNPQEHVWKASREAVSHNHKQAKMAALADVFETYLSETLFPCSLLEKQGYYDICAMFNYPENSGVSAPCRRNVALGPSVVAAPVGYWLPLWARFRRRPPPVSG
jgi:hypothetical protein